MVLSLRVLDNGRVGLVIDCLVGFGKLKGKLGFCRPWFGAVGMF